MPKGHEASFSEHNLGCGIKLAAKSEARFCSIYMPKTNSWLPNDSNIAMWVSIQAATLHFGPAL